MLVEGVKVDAAFNLELQHPHAAAYVHAYDVGNNFVPEVAGEADDAARSGVNVRHDANLLVGKHVDCQQPANLLQGSFLNVVGENLHVMSFYYLHILLILCFGDKVREVVRKLSAHHPESFNFFSDSYYFCFDYGAKVESRWCVLRYR